LEEIHKAGYIHLDINPDNLRMKNNQLYFLDFGMSKSYLKDSGEHIAYCDKSLRKGTPVFCSINTLYYRSLSRRDDLESLGYTMLYIV
jgi:serine/threonine protein kinase